MLYISPIWKEISYEEYEKITRGKSELEILLDPYIDRRLKSEVKYANIPKGIGMLETMKLLEKDDRVFTNEDYRYFKHTGKSEMVFMGGEEACTKFKEEWDKSVNLYIKNNK